MTFLTCSPVNRLLLWQQQALVWLDAMSSSLKESSS